MAATATLSLRKSQCLQVLTQTIVSENRANDRALRIHLLAFTFIPLIISWVMYAANGNNKIDYIDILLLCVSCFTNTGLSPIDISRTTAFQQALLELQMLSGSIIVVSWIMAYVRMWASFFRSKYHHSPALPRHIFKTTCQHIVEQHRSHTGLRQRLRRGTGTASPQGDIEGRPTGQRMGSVRPITKPFITRVDTILKPVNPSGAVEPVVPTQLTESPAQAPILLSPVASRSSAGHQVNSAGDHLEDAWFPNLLTTLSTTSPRGLGSPLPLGETPQPTMHASANASSVGFRQTETLRQRKPLTIPLTKATFSERPHSQHPPHSFLHEVGSLIHLVRKTPRCCERPSSSRGR